MIATGLHEAISNSLFAGISEDEAGPGGDERRQHQVIADFLLNLFQAKVALWGQQPVSIFLDEVPNRISGY